MEPVMSKLAIIVGHNKRAQGAVAVSPINQSEYVFNAQVAKIMDAEAADFGLEVGIFYRDGKLGYSGQIAKAYREADAWGADLAIELHFNGAANKSARGTVTLSSGSAKSLRFASLAQDAMVALFGRIGKQDRGVKTRARGDRGGFSLVAGNAPAILVEPFFGSSTADCDLMDRKGRRAYARALLGAAAEMFGTQPRKNVLASRNLQSHTLAGTTGAAAMAFGALDTVSPHLPVIGDMLDMVAANWKIVAITVGGIALVLAVRGAIGYLRDRKREAAK